MFLVGGADSVIHNGKIALPAEYRLKKKKLFLMWKDEKTLFLGETKGAVKFASGVENAMVDVEIDSENRLPIAGGREGQKVKLLGCVSTLEINLLNS